MEDDSANKDNEELDVVNNGKSGSCIDASDEDEDSVYQSPIDHEKSTTSCENHGPQCIPTSSFALRDNFPSAVSPDKATYGFAVDASNMFASVYPEG